MSISSTPTCSKCFFITCENPGGENCHESCLRPTCCLLWGLSEPYICAFPTSRASGYLNTLSNFSILTKLSPTQNGESALLLALPLNVCDCVFIREPPGCLQFGGIVRKADISICGHVFFFRTCRYYLISGDSLHFSQVDI